MRCEALKKLPSKTNFINLSLEPFPNEATNDTGSKNLDPFSWRDMSGRWSPPTYWLTDLRDTGQAQAESEEAEWDGGSAAAAPAKLRAELPVKALHRSHGGRCHNNFHFTWKQSKVETPPPIPSAQDTKTFYLKYSIQNKGVYPHKKVTKLWTLSVPPLVPHPLSTDT